MPPAAESLLEAAARYPAGTEDALTEVFAAVLNRVPNLTEALFASVGLPTASTYEVNTQVEGEGIRVDMEIVGLDENRRVRTRVWSEHKVDAPFGAEQVPNYRDQLARRSGTTALLTVVRAADVVASPSDRHAVALKALSWTDVALLAETTGRVMGGPNWRESADRPGLSASEWLLAELLNELEERELAQVEPLTSMDVLVISNANETHGVLETLFERVVDYLGKYKPTDKQGKPTSDFGLFWRVLESFPCWAVDDFGGWPELMSRSTDWWRPDHEAFESPCLGIGFTFQRSKVSALLDGQEWRPQVDGQEIGLAEDGKLVRCFATLYLSEAVTGGLTLDDQARFLGERAERALDQLAATGPPQA